MKNDGDMIRQRIIRNRRHLRRTIDVRHGFTIVEMIGTCVVLGALFSLVVPMLLVVARERRSTEQRQFAMQHAANLLETSTMRPWSDLEPGELTLPEIDADLKSVLPGLERSLIVRNVEGELPTRQITASIRWQGVSGQIVSPVRISAWVFPRSEGQQ